MIAVAVALAVIFGCAAGAKLAVPDISREAFAAAGVSWSLGPAIAAELALSVALPLWPRAAAAAALGLLAIFTLGLVRLAHADEAVSCHCFGTVAGGEVNGWSFARNGLLAGLSIALLVVGASAQPLGIPAGLSAALAGGLLARRPARLAEHSGGIVVFVDGDCTPCRHLRSQVGDWPESLPVSFVEDPRQARSAGVRGFPGAVRLDQRGRVMARALGAPAIEAMARQLVTAPERAYEAFGVVFSVAAEISEALLPPDARLCVGDVAPLARWVIVGEALYRDGLLDCRRGDGIAPIDRLAIEIRHLVAEHAPAHTFIHAGVVGWRGGAIIIPGASYTGKSTLVAALLRIGASYLSDEYAVLDEQGRVHPYPKPVSLRTEPGGRGVGHDPGTFGSGSIETSPLPVRAIVTCPYDPAVTGWEGVELTAGSAAMSLVANAVGIRQAPERVMTSIRAASDGAIALTGARGEADDAADALALELDRAMYRVELQA